jgi:hypothetical protein
MTTNKKKTPKVEPMPKDVLELVGSIQKERPGWRFCLLGGDVQYPYKRTKAGRIKGVDRTKTEPQGWKAEFFGGIDPQTNTGERHASSEWYASPHDAILMACAQARKAISEGAPE